MSPRFSSHNEALSRPSSDSPLCFCFWSQGDQGLQQVPLHHMGWGPGTRSATGKWRIPVGCRTDEKLVCGWCLEGGKDLAKDRVRWEHELCDGKLWSEWGNQNFWIYESNPSRTANNVLEQVASRQQPSPSSLFVEIVAWTSTMCLWWMDTIFQFLSILKAEMAIVREPVDASRTSMISVPGIWLWRKVREYLNPASSLLNHNLPDGRTVACKSGCVAYNNDQECCRGAFGTPDKCRQSRTAMMFKDACPGAYSYAYDDPSSTFTCKDANYVVQFC